MSAEPFTLCENCKNYKFYNCCCWRCKSCQSFVADNDDYKYCTKYQCDCFRGWHASKKNFRKIKKKKYKCSKCKAFRRPIQNETPKVEKAIFNEAQIDAWLESETPTEQVDIPDRYKAIMQGLVNPYKSAYLKKVADRNRRYQKHLNKVNALPPMPKTEKIPPEVAFDSSETPRMRNGLPHDELRYQRECKVLARKQVLVHRASRYINNVFYLNGTYGACSTYCAIMQELCEANDIDYKIKLGFLNLDDPIDKGSVTHCYMEIYGKIYDTMPSLSRLIEERTGDSSPRFVSETLPKGYKHIILNRKSHIGLLLQYSRLKKGTYKFENPDPNTRKFMNSIRKHLRETLTR
jgi:hypothetical protein